jgi:hypothetical protein
VELTFAMNSDYNAFFQDGNTFAIFSPILLVMRRNSRQSSAKNLELEDVASGKSCVRQNTLEWIKQFLTNRTQSVILENHKSDPLDVVSGVPQGTVMDPLLFPTYIHDLPEATSSSSRFFADDCLLFRRITSSITD